MTSPSEGRAWVAALPDDLHAQKGALLRLLDVCEALPAVTSLSVGCSLGRGAADRLSDVDAAVGVDTPVGTDGADRVREVEAALVDHLRGERLVDVLRGESSTGPFFLRRLFAQLDDGVQLDLAVVAEAEVRRGGAAPDFVAVLRRGEPVDARPQPSATRVSAEQVHEWAFLGWRALLDAHKYLLRGSVWEVHQRLHEARHHIWALWAAAQGATYPWHGLSQVLDHDPSHLPPGVEETVAGLDPEGQAEAVAAAAQVLASASDAAARRCQAPLPTAMADHVRRVLTSRYGTTADPATGPHQDA